VTDKEALQAYSRNEELNQPTIERLWKRGYLEVYDATTLDTPGDGKILKPMENTGKTRGSWVIAVGDFCMNFFRVTRTRG